MDRSQITQSVLAFRCPRFEELPRMDLYLEQVLNYVNTSLQPIRTEPMTGAMISNYVKMHALPPAVKKRYGQEHTAYLIVITILKQVFSIPQIARFFEIQRETYPIEVAYDYFCSEFENALDSTFRFTGEAMPRIETKLTDQTVLVRAVVLAAANRVYAEKIYFNDQAEE